MPEKVKLLAVLSLLVASVASADDHPVFYVDKRSLPV